MAVAATPDGQRTLSGARDKTVRVWLLDDNYSIPWPHTSRRPSRSRTHWVIAVALPDNQHALSGSGGGELKLFNFNDGAVLRKFKYYSGPESAWRCCPTVAASFAGRLNAPTSSSTASRHSDRTVP